jgi:forkhead transcription factor HCM1
MLTMASTRRSPPPLDIYEESISNFDQQINNMDQLNQPLLSSPLDTVPSLPPQMSAFGLTNGSTEGPLPTEGGQSPLKQSHPSSSPPRIVFADKINICFPPPPTPPYLTDSIVKKSNPTPYESSTASRSKSLFSSFPGLGNVSDENMVASHSDNVAEFPAPETEQNPFGEAYITLPPQVQPLTQDESSTIQLPDPQDMPVIEDDGSKPPYSYASLIAMAILRAQNRRLTLAQIYKWITDTFAFYRETDSGWQNSIRHNLSLNKSFIKQERPKNDPGKGNYWMIQPGMESTFIKEKPSRRPASSSGNPKFLPHQSSKDFGLSSSANLPPSQADVKKSEPQQILPQPEPIIAEPSSDATIPASDPALFEESMPPPTRPLLSSPLHTLHSSPPVPGHQTSREATPALGVDIPSSQIARSKKKRNFSTMNDSGYFSSLESSAARPHAGNHDLSIPRFKRGRAEEEIARLRSSSHDISPHKNSALLRKSQLLSSSPIRLNDNFLLPPIGAPITPGITFKKPKRPPPSVSPNTNLRNHRNRIRELIGSPIKFFEPAEDDVFSPAFRLDEDDSGLQDSFAIYNDSPIKSKNDRSPEKRGSAKRPRLDRAASALADITGTSQKLNPTLNRPVLGSPLRSKSSMKSPSKSMQYGLVDFGTPKLLDFDFLIVEPENEDPNGLDLLAGFQKIGEKENNSPIRFTKSGSRPVLGNRSMTTNF